jgi:hypothetical protein
VKQLKHLCFLLIVLMMLCLDFLTGNLLQQTGKTRGDHRILLAGCCFKSLKFFSFRAASGANSPILMEISDLRDKNRSMSAQIQTLDYRLRISSQERKALVAENKALLEAQSRLTLNQSVLNSQLR